MNKIEIENIENLEILGIGSESKVYQYKDEAIKIFMNKSSIRNKEKKIILIHDLNIKNIVKPNNIIINSKGKTIGYSLNKIETNFDENLWHYNTNTNSLDKKIEKLKALEETLKELHKNNITMVDFNYFNFLLDKEDNLNIIDSDNYRVGKLKEDLKPILFYKYYKKKYGKIDENYDKFAYGMQILITLPFLPFLMDYFSDTPKDNLIETIINDLDINSKLKDYFYNLLDPKTENEYIGSRLDLLSSSRPYIKNKRSK
ncbi:MAG: hypothetical protein RSH78_05455 [Bacilli bacterium]